jgi:hypothetical protein
VAHFCTFREHLFSYFTGNQLFTILANGLLLTRFLKTKSKKGQKCPFFAQNRPFVTLGYSSMQANKTLTKIRFWQFRYTKSQLYK